MSEPNFKASQWIAWIGASSVALLGVTAAAFQTFETREHARESGQKIEARVESFQADLVRRLERMEDKLDRAIGHNKGE